MDGCVCVVESACQHLRTVTQSLAGRTSKAHLASPHWSQPYNRSSVWCPGAQMLYKLAEKAHLKEKVEHMFDGTHLNVTEDRAVLHVALRAPRDYVSPCLHHLKSTPGALCAPRGYVSCPHHLGNTSCALSAFLLRPRMLCTTPQGLLGSSAWVPRSGETTSFPPVHAAAGGVSTASSGCRISQQGSRPEAQHSNTVHTCTGRVLCVQAPVLQSGQAC